MSEHLPSDLPPEDPRVERRAELLDDERDAGSADPETQAEVILSESDIRQVDREDPEGSQVVEHRTSDDTVDPT